MKKSIIEKILLENKVDAVLLFSTQNRFWYSRFTSSLGYLLITKKNSYLLLDGRYVTAAKTSKDIINVDEIIEVIPGKDSFFSLINEKLKKDNSNSLIIESDWLTINQGNNFRKYINADIKEFNFESIREVKDSFEIERIKKACEITHSVFLDVLKWIKPGITEKDLARYVSDSFLKHGAQKLSFDTIVASGENGSMPHAVPSDKIIKENEFVTLDMGCYYQGYCSDQTRTFALGDGFNSKLKEIYDVVYKSQSAGIEMIKPGVKCIDIHNKCFEIIDKAGFGQYFTHGTGHGIGIEIHEEPYNASGSIKILQENMAITVEPGIYIPGVGGVRIEDDILVTKDGYEFLTTPFRELQIVK